MKYYEKAVENYAKKLKEYYDKKWKEAVLKFNRNVEYMTATGECRGMVCDDCPMRLLPDAIAKDVHCGTVEPERVKELIAMEEQDGDDGSHKEAT